MSKQRTARSTRGPLDGLLVVGLEHSVAGPLCTRVLADLGARVIKVERPPNGDFARHWDGNVDGECSQFWWLNRRKLSVALDLKSERGCSVLGRLLDQADVLVSNLSPRAIDRLGLTPERLGKLYPKLVICQISGYGRSGSFRDRKAYDMLVQAEAGVMSLTGSPEQPSRAGVSISDVGTGIYASTVILAALLDRTRHGRGRHLDVAMFDATLEFAAPMLISFLNAGVSYPRLPDRHHAIAPYGVFECADSVRVLLAIEQDSEWQTFAAAVLGDPGLGSDPRFATPVARLQNRAEVDALVATALAKLDGGAAARLLDSMGLAYASLNGMEDVARHPAVAERGMLASVETSAGSTAMTLIGLAERLFETSADGRDRPPNLGEDTESVLGALGLSTEECAGRRR